MADFQYMIQPQGVTIPISIFGQADAAGIAAGNAQKTTGQAIAEGVTGAIQGFTQTVGAFQQNEIRQNQIDMQPVRNEQERAQLQGLQQENVIRQNQVENLPTTNAIREEQLKSAQTENEIKALQVDIEKQTHQLQLDDAKAKLVADKNKLDQETAKNDIINALGSDSAAERQKIFYDPKLQASMWQDPKFAESVYQTLKARGDFAGKPDVEKRFIDTLDSVKERDLQRQKELLDQKINSAGMKDVDKVIEKMNEGKLAYLSQQYKLDSEGFADRVKVFPAGVKNTKFVGNKEYLDESSTKPDGPAISKDFDVFVNQNGQWEKANVALPDTEQDTLSRFQTFYKSTPEYKGLARMREIANQNKQPASAPAAAPGKPSDLFTYNPFKGQARPEGAPPPAMTPAPMATRATATPAPQGTPPAFTPAPVGAGGAPQAAAAMPAVPMTPAPQGMASPAPTGVQVAAKSTDPITKRMQEQLQMKAQNDPDLKNRLVLKGVARDLTVQAEPAPVPTAAPEAVGESPAPEQAAAQPAAPVEPVLRDENVVAPRPTPDLKRNIAYRPVVDEVYEGLPAGAQKHVKADTMLKVMSEPMLDNLDSLQKAVVAVESAGVKSAKSPTGAVGFFQLTTPAAKDTGVDRHVPKENIAGGVKYLGSLMKRYGGDVVPALMAYNVGMGVIDRAIDMAQSTDWEDLVAQLDYMRSRGMYPNLLTEKKVKEAAQYPIKVLAYKEAFDKIVYA